MRGRLILIALLLAAAAGARADTLRLSKTALELHADDGRLLDRRPLRAKRLDQRADGADLLGLLQDADSGVLQLWRARDGRLVRAAQWRGPDFALEQLCLYRDGQGLLHGFLLGEEGLSEQWLLDGAQVRSVRRLSTPPKPAACHVRDAEETLYIAEPQVGLWAYAADAERPARRLLSREGTLEAWLETHPAVAVQRPPAVLPIAQTEPMQEAGDAADDPAIWVHAHRPARSRVLGTDKKRGLAVYDLQGQQRQFLAVGRVNNVDLRQGLRYGGRRVDLAAATQRDEGSVVLFGIAPDGHVTELARLPTGLSDIYGICVGRNQEGGLDIFPNDKDGRVLQLRLRQSGGRWQAEHLREIRLASQVEGCVVDDAGQALFVGEEKRGVWRLDLAQAPAEPALVIPVGGALVADVEGLSIHTRSRLLVVSSQGSDSFAVYDTRAPYALRGSFAVGLNARRSIDAVSETDGLDVSSADLGGDYADGLLVVQDGHKRLPQGRQNFKLVPWRDVAKVLN